MADKRMFSKKIIDSDAFLDMSPTAQNLYFHLCMRADDDGFVNNPNSIRRTVGASEDDFKILFAKRFLLRFESGVIVIKHWRMHNAIQKDRYKPTVYQKELSMLIVKDNKSYTDNLNYNTVSVLDTKCIQNGYRMDTQVRIGKDRLDKNSVVVEDTDTNTPTLENIRKFAKEQNLIINIVRFYSYYNEKGWNTVKDWKVKALEWNETDLKANKTPNNNSKGNKFNNYPQRDTDVKGLQQELLRNQ